MDKPIIALNIDGLLIDHLAFSEPHKEWFIMASKLTGDESFLGWVERPDYFEGVKLAMEKIMPLVSDEEKIKQARIGYQRFVIDYINNHSDLIDAEIINFLTLLKETYTLALVTTNTSNYIYEILSSSKIENLFDIVLASELEKEPFSEEIILEFTKKFGLPKYYLASRGFDAFKKFNDSGVFCIYFSKGDFDPEMERYASFRADEIGKLKSFFDSVKLCPE